MEIGDSLSIGDILKRNDEKSLIFADIHEHIVKLCGHSERGTKEKFSIFFEEILIADIGVIIQDWHSKQIEDDTYESDALIVYDSLLIYRDAIRFLRNDINTIINPLIRSAYKPVTDLYLLNETYKSVKKLEFHSSLDFAKYVLKRFTSKEAEKYISERNSKAAKIKHENQRQAEKPVVDEIIRLWD